MHTEKEVAARLRDIATISNGSAQVRIFKHKLLALAEELDPQPKPVEVGAHVHQIGGRGGREGYSPGVIVFIDPDTKVALVRRDKPTISVPWYRDEFNDAGKDGSIKFYMRHVTALEAI